MNFADPLMLINIREWTQQFGQGGIEGGTRIFFPIFSENSKREEGFPFDGPLNHIPSRGSTLHCHPQAPTPILSHKILGFLLHPVKMKFMFLNKSSEEICVFVFGT